MGATPDIDRPALEPDDLSPAIGADGLPAEILAPIVAGAFARGLAEAFGLLGLPMLMLDREGHVLVVGEAARPALAGGLQVRAGHLLARSADDNRALSDFVAMAVTDPKARPSVTLKDAGRSLRALPVPSQADQLLRTVVLID